MRDGFVSSKVAAIPPSGIRRFFDIASTVEGAISLGVGEPDFVTPYHIRSAGIDSLISGETQYTANQGLLPLRREIAGYLKNRFSLEYSPEKEILVTVGASEAIDLAFRAVLDRGDGVLLPDPGYVSYSPCVILADGVPQMVPTDEAGGFKLTRKALENASDRSTKALMLPYPNNPTGTVLDEKTLEDIAAFCVERDLLVVTDEIYAELSYEGRVRSIASCPGMKERTIYISGFSKAFAMTGWRLGYACAPAEILSQMNKIHQYTIMCASRQSQVAGMEALRQGKTDQYADIEKMKESYNRRRRLMVSALRDMGLDCIEPKGTFYCFPGIASTGLDSETFCTRLLQEKGVVCVPGNAFGKCGEGHIRCCYATDIQKMSEAFRRMKDFIGSL